MASSRFGELLRSQREAAGMGLDHVSSVTRIRRKFLEVSSVVTSPRCRPAAMPAA